jgi:hypothetical protein
MRHRIFGDRVRGVRIWCMIKRVLFAALVFAAPVCLVAAQDAKVSVVMMVIGGMSCAHWRSTQEHLLEGTVWIYGFWTGLNYVAAASDQTQAKIDLVAIVSLRFRSLRRGKRLLWRCSSPWAAVAAESAHQVARARKPPARAWQIRCAALEMRPDRSTIHRND